MQCPQCRSEIADTSRFCTSCGTQLQGPAAIPAAPVRYVNEAKSGAWIALVIGAGALVLIAVIGIIAAIAIPNLLNAVDRGKQKRTMADLRSIGTAMESYAVDFEHYPRCTTLAELSASLEPVYIKKLPLNDGWGTPLDVASDGKVYVIRSRGKDRAPDTCDGGGTRDMRADICFSVGSFTQWPEGERR